MGTPVILNWTPPLTTWRWESRWEVDLNTRLFVHEFLLYFGFPSDLFNIIRAQLLRIMINLQRFLLVIIKNTVQTGFVNCFLPQRSGLKSRNSSLWNSERLVLSQLLTVQTASSLSRLILTLCSGHRCVNYAVRYA